MDLLLEYVPRVLEHMPDAVVVCDRSGAIRYANHTTESLFGYAPAELIGAPLLALIPERYRAAHALDVDAYFAQPRVRPMALGLALAGLRKDGREFPVDVSLAPVSVEAATYAIASIRDVSEHRRLEERERELRIAAEEIRHRDKVLAIASHELRTPVGSLQLQVGLLQRAAAATAAELAVIGARTSGATRELETIRERMGKVERHARRLGTLIEQLIDTAHVHRGRLPLKLEDADLAELTRETVAGLREEIARSGSEVTLRAAAPVPGRWDPIRIEQVIANLVVNAAKYGRGRPISVTVERAGEQARLSVEDRGVGIPPQDHERVFEQFERAAAAGSALGLGLGLYIARQIVLAHGGAISLRSAPDVGSTFTVDLPRVTAEP